MTMGAEPIFLLVDEAAVIARTTVATIRWWVQVGKLPATKPGRRVLIRRDILIRFLDGEHVSNDMPATGRAA